MSDEPIRTAEEIIPQEEKPNIGNIFDDLKERLSSPFIFSFVISWLVANWRIVIGTFWFDADDLRRANYENHIDLIEKNLDWWPSAIIPFLSAIVYCFLYPYFRDYIKVRQAALATKTNKSILEKSRTGVVPMQKLIKLREDYASLTQSTTQLLTDESKIKEDNTRLTAENAKLQVEVGKLKLALEILSTWNRVDIIKGRWYLTILGVTRNILIEADRFNSIDQPSYFMSITSVLGNPQTREIYFSLKSVDPSIPDVSYSVTLSDDSLEMKGYQQHADRRLPVQFEKNESVNPKP